MLYANPVFLSSPHTWFWYSPPPPVSLNLDLSLLSPVRGSFSFELLGLGFASFGGFKDLTKLAPSLGVEGKAREEDQPCSGGDCGWGDKAVRVPPAGVVEDGRWGGVGASRWHPGEARLVCSWKVGGGSGGREPPEKGAEGSWMMWWGHDMENMLIGEQLRRSSWRKKMILWPLDLDLRARKNFDVGKENNASVWYSKPLNYCTNIFSLKGLMIAFPYDQSVTSFYGSCQIQIVWSGTMISSCM